MPKRSVERELYDHSSTSPTFAKAMAGRQSMLRKAVLMTIN